MANVAIRADDLGKKYRLGTPEKYKTFRDTLAHAAVEPFRRAYDLLSGHNPALGTSKESFWALKDVSFQIKKGEVVGVIGHNGAGKSTLLKILSRITEPTEGEARIYGRVGALLEVGTGFHPELTGRENIYLNSAILGMSRKDINRKFDEIVAFAEVEKFIDTPVKFYSSGMGLRLGFSVAAHLEPEILVVDEVLAVGDIAFQRKCLGKMQEVSSEGRTVLFVSHNMTAVQGLCTRVIWLKDGQVQEDGIAGQVISDYITQAVSTATERTWPDIEQAPGNDRIRIRRACVRAANGDSGYLLTIRTPLVMEFEYWNLKPDTVLNLSVTVENSQGILVFNTATLHEPQWNGRAFPVGLFRSSCTIPGDLLNNGLHNVTIHFVENVQLGILTYDNILGFEVSDSSDNRGNWNGNWPGAVRPLLPWLTEHLESAP